MNVTIFGTGNMGKGIGTRAVAGGHNVTFIGTSAAAAEKVAGEVRLLAKKGASVSTGNLKDAVLGDIVVLAVWYGTNLELAKVLGSRLAGKVVIDIANPVNATYDGLVTAADSSSAEDVAKVVSPGAKVVKAFNTTFAGTLMTGQITGQQLDVFIAGDDVDAKKKVAEMVRDGGMRPLDAGPLNRSRQIEGMQLLQIVLQNQLGTNWGSGIKFIG